MRIFMTCPVLTPHGGIRVILEWASRLSERGHAVTLRTDDRSGHEWFGLPAAVRVAHDDAELRGADCLVACSPHAIDYLEREDGPVHRFAFLQMAEHLFRPSDQVWAEACRRFYLTPYPLILISRWNEQLVRDWGRTGPTHYVGNGVNLDHFPLSDAPKDGKTVLVEGWWPTNPTKDERRVAARVASRLRSVGYRIIAYGLSRNRRDAFRRVPHEFIKRPSAEQLNNLYEEATILLKATRCDARSCSPMEAMTKGTVTARAIEQGDDDLRDGENCLRVPYEVEPLYQAARTLLEDAALRNRLAQACREYVRVHSWDFWMDRIEGVLCAP